MGFEPTTTSTCCDVSTVLCQLSYEANWELIIYTAVSRKVVQQNRTRQCRKVLWVVRVYGI